MLANIKYEEKTSKKIFCGKEYIITHLVPNLKKEEKQKIKNDIESKLFNVFKKYV